MNKEYSHSAARLRRSAVAERLRLREEWSALKGIEDNTQQQKVTKRHVFKSKRQQTKEIRQPIQAITSEALRGVVAFVEVGSEPRALALRAALNALGASVVPAWSPLVTHLIWTEGGCRKIRAKARALACQLVSPLWVEACASAAKRLPERIFPAPTRPSDLPSPATLRQLLKKAEHENIPLADLLSDSRDSDDEKPRLRISTDTENDKSRDKSTDQSHDQSHDKSSDQSHDKSSDQSQDKSTDKSKRKANDKSQNRVNTLPRRALLKTQESPIPVKSKRKLFIQKEAVIITTEDKEANTPTPARPKRMLTQQQKRELRHAEKIARKLIKTPIKTIEKKKSHTQNSNSMVKIVLTGMSKSERRKVVTAIKTLNGKIQSKVNKRTTHVLLGSCKEDGDNEENNQDIEILDKENQNVGNKQQNVHRSHTDKGNNIANNRNIDQDDQITNNQEIISENDPLLSQSQVNLSMCNQCNRPEDILEKLFSDANLSVEDHCNNEIDVPEGTQVICHKIQISGINALTPEKTRSKKNIVDTVNKNIKRLGAINDPKGDSNEKTKHLNENKDKGNENNKKTNESNNKSNDNNKKTNENSNNFNENNNSVMCLVDVVNKPRTVNALLGAVRGCRVLNIQWAIDSAKNGHWLPHYGYEVPHLLKVSQKARVERSALGRMHSEYAYDVFNGIKVRIRENAVQKPAITQLITLCGGQIQDGDYDVTIGQGEGEISSKWVFDSIQAGRMRTTRRYINRNVPGEAIVLTQS